MVDRGALTPNEVPSRRGLDRNIPRLAPVLAVRKSPHAGDWIETSINLLITGQWKSPHAGDWIETIKARRFSPDPQVPSRRGLDRNGKNLLSDLEHFKSPHAGDWIETRCGLYNAIQTKSPHAGDWIETLSLAYLSILHEVPSRRGLDRNPISVSSAVSVEVPSRRGLDRNVLPAVITHRLFKSPHAGDWIETAGKT